MDLDHLGLVLSFVGRLEAIRKALDYDVRKDPINIVATLWRTNMAAWKLAALP